MRMNKIRAAQSTLLILLLIIFAVVSIRTVSAAEMATATIRVEQSFTVNDSRWTPDDTFSYVMEPEDVSSPMPQGTEQGAYHFTLKGDGHVDVGPMTYTRTGQYIYTLQQEITQEKEDYTYDEEVYRVTVTVRNAENGGLSATVELPRDESGYKEEKIKFENSYDKEIEVSPTPTPGSGTNGGTNGTGSTTSSSSPKTGDPSQISLFTCMMVFSMAGMLLILIMAKRQRRERGEV